MRLTLLFIFTLLLSAFTLSNPKWEVAKLSPKVSVQLPSVPELEKGQGVLGYRAHNGRTAFVASAVELALPDIEKLTNYDKRVILMGAERGTLNQIKAEALSSSEFKVGATEERAFSFRAIDTETGTEFIHHMRLMIVGSSMYSFHCWFAEDDKEAAQDKETFFSSIEVKL